MEIKNVKYNYIIIQNYIIYNINIWFCISDFAPVKKIKYIKIGKYKSKFNGISEEEKNYNILKKQTK